MIQAAIFCKFGERNHDLNRFYAAGSVKHFARTVLERGAALTSAQGINAIPVAEFTLGQILLANKGYFRNVAEYRETPRYDIFRGRGNFGTQVSILGAGQIGRRLIKEVERMGEFAIDEFERWSHGEPLRVPIAQAMLETMA